MKSASAMDGIVGSAGVFFYSCPNVHVSSDSCGNVMVPVFLLVDEADIGNMALRGHVYSFINDRHLWGLRASLLSSQPDAEHNDAGESLYE